MPGLTPVKKSVLYRVTIYFFSSIAIVAADHLDGRGAQERHRLAQAEADLANALAGQRVPVRIRLQGNDADKVGLYTRGLGCVRMHFPVFAFSSVRCSDTQGTQTDAELAENQEAARRVSTDEEARIVPFQTVSVVPLGLEPRTP